jgi:hypothetical protein
MRSFAVLITALAATLVPGGMGAHPGTGESGNAKLSIQVVVEKQQGGNWERVDPQTVFHSGENIRFRYRATRGGYLFVLNSSSDKTTSWIFPRAGSAERSRVEPGVEYIIPTGQGAFEVAGTPGFDVTYWILSPTPIDSTQSFVPTSGNQVSTLQPRCRSDALKSRGLCVDEHAGPHSVDDPVNLPVHPPENDKLHSRDLKFKSQEGTTQISGVTQQSDVVVYEFTIAHE